MQLCPYVGIGLALGGVAVTWSLFYWCKRPQTEAFVPLSEAAPDDETVPFHESFVEELKSLPEEDLSGRFDLLEAEVTIEAPAGQVDMRLESLDPGRFKYWSNSNSVEYRDLEAVARYFCIENNCKGLYIDSATELHEATTECSKERETANTKRDSVFLVPKAYNLGRGGKVHRRGKKPCPKRANQFKRLGKLDARDEVCPATSANHKKLSYAEWRAMAKAEKED